MRLRAQGAGHRAQSTEHRAQGAGHRAQSTGRRAQSTEHRAQGTGRRAQGTGRRAEERRAASGTREEHETCSLDVRRNTQKRRTARPQDLSLPLPLSKNPPQTMGDLEVDFRCYSGVDK